MGSTRSKVGTFSPKPWRVEATSTQYLKKNRMARFSPREMPTAQRAPLSLPRSLHRWTMMPAK